MQLLKVRGVLKANVPQNHFYKLKKHIGKTAWWREVGRLAATVDDRNMCTVWPGCNISIDLCIPGHFIATVQNMTRKEF